MEGFEPIEPKPHISLNMQEFLSAICGGQEEVYVNSEDYPQEGIITCG